MIIQREHSAIWQQRTTVFRVSWIRVEPNYQWEGLYTLISYWLEWIWTLIHTCPSNTGKTLMRGHQGGGMGAPEQQVKVSGLVPVQLG